MALSKRSYAAIELLMVLAMSSQAFGNTMVGDYKQCGGSGGDCKNFCDDAPWPNHKCSSSNAKCDRLSAWHWQCQPGSNGDSHNNGGNNGNNGQENNSGKTIATWQQCGGKGGECQKYGNCADAPFGNGYACASGNTCVKQDEWYWQCRAGPSSRSADSESSRNSGGNSHLAVGDWQQCGGKGGDMCKKYSICGDMPYIKFFCTNPSYSCQRVDEWYWQCKPFSGNNNNNQNGNNNNQQGNNKQIGPWQQCGGKGGDCNKFSGCSDSAFSGASCSGGNSCKRMDQWYWQCQPGSSSRSASIQVSETEGDQTVEFEFNTEDSTTSRSAQPSGQSIGMWQQCGGKGGECNKFGGCSDAAFRGASCASGSTCKRQDEWYWQCQPGGNNNINTNNNGGNGGNENNGGKGIGMWQQCGGKGGECNKFGGCSDAAFRGASCSGGSVCKRQDEWYWQCQPGSGSSRGFSFNDVVDMVQDAAGDFADAVTDTWASATSRSGGSTLKLWDACGGKNGPGCNGRCSDAPTSGYTCAAGTSCKRMDEWFWQCQPSGSGGSGGSGGNGGNLGNGGNSGGNESTTKPSGVVLNKWQQCGGTGGDCGKFSCQDGPYPSASCPSGTTCQKQSQWFYQCL